MIKRLDWRFVLPEAATGQPYRHLVLLGASDRLLDETVSSGIAERVTRAADKPASADALVILNGAEGAARAALDWLAPGGAVYWETHRPAAARSALRRRGVRPIADYWVLASFESAHVYLPLDRPLALRWYVSSMVRAITPAERLLQVTLRQSVRFAVPLLALAAPRHALTGTLGSDGRLPLLSDARQRPIMLTLGDAWRRVVLLPFAPHSYRPDAVLKLSRVATLNEAVEQEQRALAAIRARLDPLMRASIPEPLGTFCWRDLLVGIESCAEGRPLSTSRQGIDDLRLVAGWITRLHVEAPIERTVWGEALLQEWVADPLTQYAQRFGLTPPEQRLFDTVQARARDLLGEPMPLVWTHWGFAAQNIFRHARGLVVLDWEGGSPGPPGLDLLHYVTTWSFDARKLRGRSAELQGFRELFCEPVAVDAACAAAREAIHGYLRRLGVNERFLPVLLVVVCVFRALGQAVDTPRSANRYAQYVGALAACDIWRSRHAER